MTTESGSNARLPADARERIRAYLEAEFAKLRAEEQRVLATTPVEDPGQDYDPPAPTQDDPGGFDPLP